MKWEKDMKWKNDLWGAFSFSRAIPNEVKAVAVKKLAVPEANQIKMHYDVHGRSVEDLLKKMHSDVVRMMKENNVRGDADV